MRSSPFRGNGLVAGNCSKVNSRLSGERMEGNSGELKRVKKRQLGRRFKELTTRDNGTIGRGKGVSFGVNERRVSIAPDQDLPLNRCKEPWDGWIAQRPAGPGGVTGGCPGPRNGRGQIAHATICAKPVYGSVPRISLYFLVSSMAGSLRA